MLRYQVDCQLVKKGYSKFSWRRTKGEVSRFQKGCACTCVMKDGWCWKCHFVVDVRNGWLSEKFWQSLYKMNSWWYGANGWRETWRLSCSGARWKSEINWSGSDGEAALVVRQQRFAPDLIRTSIKSLQAIIRTNFFACRLIRPTHCYVMTGEKVCENYRYCMCMCALATWSTGLLWNSGFNRDSTVVPLMEESFYSFFQRARCATFVFCLFHQYMLLSRSSLVCVWVFVSVIDMMMIGIKSRREEQ